MAVEKIIPEAKVKRDVFKKLGSRNDIRVFRNNVGMAYMGKIITKNSITITINNYRVVKFGLFKGSGDLIGWKSTTITQEMVGHKIAQFISIEVKRQRGRRRPEQIKWAKNIDDAGGKAIFAENSDFIEI